MCITFTKIQVCLACDDQVTAVWMETCDSMDDDKHKDHVRSLTGEIMPDCRKCRARAKKAEEEEAAKGKGKGKAE